jgi:hypothetical protein
LREPINASSNIDCLAEMGSEQRLMTAFVGGEGRIAGQFQILEQLERPEIKPVASVKGDWETILYMHRRPAPSHRTFIFNIINDQRACMDKFQHPGANLQFSSRFGAWLRFVANQLIGQRHHSPAYLLAGIRGHFPYRFDQGVEQNVLDIDLSVQSQQVF